MKLWNYLDIDKLEQHIADGLVDVRFHDNFPLAIYTYARKAIYENVWDDVTTKCRGLIVDKNSGDIVARPFEKFFNLDTDYRPETQLANLPRHQPVVHQKLDGSLGILYAYNGQQFIASKGSFHSEHAEWATAYYRKHCVNPQWPEQCTPVFEMICESVQHHVVHYGQDALVLLALIDNETGEEADYNTLYHWAYVNGIPAVSIYSKSLDQVLSENTINEEGYVLTWARPGQSAFKVKVKFADFLKMQRIVHDATPRRIFEALSAPGEDRDTINTWLSQGTPELRKFVSDWVKKLNTEYHRIWHKSIVIVQTAMAQCTTRKEYAELFLRDENRLYAPVCFNSLDEKDYRRSIWKLIEPLVEGQQPFAQVDEEELEYAR